MTDRSDLARRIAERSTLRGEFLLRSGKTSNIYFDKYLFEGDPALLRDIVRSMRPLVPAGVDALAGLEMGVHRFDTSIAGLGGCPFAGNRAAAGNICTEDVALMCEEMGIDTGLDLDKLAEAARLAESIVGHPLPGKFMKAGRIRRASRESTV